VYSSGSTAAVINATGSSTNATNYPRLYLSGCSISNGNASFTGSQPALSVSGFNVSECNFCNINHSATNAPAMLVQNLSGVANSSSIVSMVSTVVTNNYGSTALSYITQYTSSTAGKTLVGTINNCTFSHYPANSTDAAVLLGSGGGTGSAYIAVSFVNSTFLNQNISNANNPFISTGSLTYIISINNLLQSLQTTAQAFRPYASAGAGNVVLYSGCSYQNGNLAGTNTITYPSSGFAVVQKITNDTAAGGGGGVITNGTVAQGNTFAGSNYTSSIASGQLTVNTPNQNVNTGSTVSFGAVTATGAVKMTGLASGTQTNVLGINTTTGALTYQAAGGGGGSSTPYYLLYSVDPNVPSPVPVKSYSWSVQNNAFQNNTDGYNATVPANSICFISLALAAVTTNKNWGTPAWGTSSTNTPFLYFPTAGIYMINWNLALGVVSNVNGCINYNPDFVNNFGDLPNYNSSLVGCYLPRGPYTGATTITALVNINTAGPTGDYITLCIQNNNNAPFAITSMGPPYLLSIAKVG
jgi:hypothetical protein